MNAERGRRKEPTMKKKIINITLILIPLLTLFFFYYTARRGVLMFRDSLQTDIRTLAREQKLAVFNGIHHIRSSLKTMAASGEIRHTLAQFDVSESLEKGQLYIKRRADLLNKCVRIRLVNLANKIVVDTKEPGLEGKPLLPAEMNTYGSVTAEKERISFLKDGSMVILVPTKELAGNVTGGIYATFHRDFFIGLLRGKSDTSRNYRYYFANDVLFFNLPRKIGDRTKITKIASYLRKTLTPYYQNNFIVVPDRKSGFPYVFAYAGDRDQAGLPTLALWIIGINAVIFLAVVLWVLLSHKAEKQRHQLNEYRDEIDTIGEKISRTTATADQIILQTENLYQMTEKGSRDLASAASERKVVQQVAATRDEHVPSVDEVLAAKASRPDGGFIQKVKDEELQNLIDSVSSEASLEETEMDNQTNRGIFGAEDLEQYWSNMEPLLKKSLGINVFILHEYNEDGTFNVSKYEGFDDSISNSFTLFPDEPLYRLFPEKRKVLFIKDNVLGNKTLQSKFSGSGADNFAQLAMIPIVKQEQLVGLLTICTRPDDPTFDIYSLHEIMYLSML